MPPPLRPALSKRIKLAIRAEIHRIKAQYEPTRTGYKKPSLVKRIRRYFRDLRKDVSTSKRPVHKQFPHKPSISRRIRHEMEDRRITKMKKKGHSSQGTTGYKSLSRRLRYSLKEQRLLFAMVFSRDYLVIMINSLALNLLAFFIVFFMTQLLTGIAAYLTEISTMLSYNEIDYKIHSYDWSFNQIVTVFSIPWLVVFVLMLIVARVFEAKKEDEYPVKWYQMITNKQRERLFTRPLDEIAPKKKKIHKRKKWYGKIFKKIDLSWYSKLFLLWLLFHATTYFFSGMLFSILFYRRIGYVIWHVFDYYPMNFFFAGLSFLFLLVLGFVYAGKFLASGRMYFNHLVDRNRMPFVMAQVILPFYLGLIIIVLLMIPNLSYTLIAMNLSMVFLLLPLQYKAAHYPEIQYDNTPKSIKIQWDWVFLSLVIALALYLPLKIGIFIQL